MTVTHNLNFDLEELFSDDISLLTRTPSVSSSLLDESWSNVSTSEEMPNDPSSPVSYPSSASYTTIHTRSKWSDDRLEWIDLVDPNEDGKFKCPKCVKLYTRKSNLKAHFASAHIGIKRFECCGCSRQFVRRSYVKQHQRICKKLS